MANFYTSPNMSLTIPVVSAQIGPDWASNLNASLTVLDSHNHSPGSGVPIPTSGMNINADLTFNNTNNLTNARSLRLFPQSAPIGEATDLGCLYESGVDLYYNDGSGNQIRITQSGSVAGSTGTITGLPSGTASAAYASGTGTFVFQQATSTGANLDVASVAIRYPGSYPTPSGNYIQLQAPSALATGYSLTLPALPAANNTFLTISTAGVITSGAAVDNSTLEISAGVLQVKALGIGTSQLANNAVETNKIANGQVTGAKIASATITGDNIASATIHGANLVSNPAFSGANGSFNSQYVTLATPSAAAASRVMYGALASTGGSSGVGWSQSKTGTGTYSVGWTLGNAWSAVPAVTLTAITSGSANLIVTLTSEPTAGGGFTYKVVSQLNDTTTAVDAEVMMTVIGLN